MNKRMKNHGLLAIFTIVGLMAVGWTGCGENPALTDGTGYTGDNPPNFLSAYAPGMMPAASDPVWYEVASEGVNDDGGTVSGSRYSLHFPEDWADTDGKRITIREHDPNVVDMEFLPHGLQFSRTVTLTIDLSGTNADPDSPNYDGSVPVFYYYNDVTDQWDEIPSSVDGTTMVVSLSHFSRYAVAGRPGDGTADW